jgi:hypothetical protein
MASFLQVARGLVLFGTAMATRKLPLDMSARHRIRPCEIPFFFIPDPYIFKYNHCENFSHARAYISMLSSEFYRDKKSFRNDLRRKI